MQQRTLSLPAVAGPGLVAGVAGAVLIDAYLILTQVVIAHAYGVQALYQYVASGALGAAAYANPGAVYFGAAIHLVVSIAWAVGYAFVAARTPQVLARPVLSGTAFGIVVMISMQLVEVAANIYRLPTSASLLNALVAHVAFFGIPVALIVSKRLR